MHNVDANDRAKAEMPDFASIKDDIASAFMKSPLGKLFSG